ncbi:MAG: hypothetical protein ABFS14_10505 [Gemmatimonadota bacterium]
MLVIGSFFLAAPRPLNAQLISPGKLTSVHSGLDGARNCTSCHELRKQGVQNERCLACHEPLAALISEGRGLHPQLEGSCGRCHKDHSGRDFQMVRFDSLGFDHSRTGFEFEGAHSDAVCRDCHTPNLITKTEVRVFKRRHGALDGTWLGLGTTCISCHRRDAPHRDQFEQATCTDCHGQAEWSPAPGFDHDQARYRLTGRHRKVQCADCHPTDRSTTPAAVHYRPLRFRACTSCHEDEHQGDMGSTCTNCHSTSGWDIDAAEFESGFDHSSVGYALQGAHASIGCSDCHDPDAGRRDGIGMTFRGATLGRAYPAPAAESCTDCHLDYHEAAFAESASGDGCDGCHTESAWHPSNYDLFRHNKEASFSLEGAHLAATCGSCHTADETGSGGLRFEIAEQSCTACHAEDAPHHDQFAPKVCEDCHGTESFQVPDFDHDQTAYPLDGAHYGVECEACHVTEEVDGRPFARYKPLDTSCRACHGGTR